MHDAHEFLRSLTIVLAVALAGTHDAIAAAKAALHAS